MRITFNRVCERIYRHYGKENVLQIRKPDHKPFYIVDLVEGTVTLYREDLLRIQSLNNDSMREMESDFYENKDFE